MTITGPVVNDGADSTHIDAVTVEITADLRLPWEAPAKPGRLTPVRVRRAFPDLHQALPRLTSGSNGPARDRRLPRVNTESERTF